MYASPEAREAEIEDGATRTGLELQTDLDTSAGPPDRRPRAAGRGGPSDPGGQPGAGRPRSRCAAASSPPPACCRSAGSSRWRSTTWTSTSATRSPSFEPEGGRVADRVGRLPGPGARRVPAGRPPHRVRLHHDGRSGRPPGSRSRGPAPALVGWLTNRLEPKQSPAPRDCASPASEPASQPWSACRVPDPARWPRSLVPVPVVDRRGPTGRCPNPHVTRGGAPLTFALSPTVTATKVSVGPGDNNAYLLACGGAMLLVDAADDADNAGRRARRARARHRSSPPTGTPTTGRRWRRWPGRVGGWSLTVRTR